MPDHVILQRLWVLRQEEFPVWLFDIWASEVNGLLGLGRIWKIFSSLAAELYLCELEPDLLTSTDSLNKHDPRNHHNHTHTHVHTLLVNHLTSAGM